MGRLAGFTGSKAVRLPNHPYKTLPLVCVAAMAAVVMPGDSSLLWITGALFALAGPVLSLFEEHPVAVVPHE